MKEINYEELEGKEIDFKPYLGDRRKGIIVGCDPDIGITIVDKEDKDIYLMCLVGPSSPLWQESYDKVSNKNKFDIIVNMLKSGRYNSIELSMKTGRSPLNIGRANASSCPFGQ